MVDTARQLLDELMGRNRNLDPASAQSHKINWDDPEFCLYFLVKFCPHDLFVNTRADLGQCPKVHDEEAKRLYDEARPSVRKRDFEDEFMRFSNHMLCEVDRKIAKGKQRLQLMNKNDALQPGAGAASGGAGAATAANATKYQDHISDLSARIKKLIGEAEEAGNRGDVDQAQGLMTLCDQLKDEKDALVRQLEGDASDVAAAAAATAPSAPGEGPSSSSASVSSSSDGKPNESHNGSAGGGGRAGGRANNDGSWPEFHSTEKQMEVCEVCGAFLIVGDAQQRLEDHLTGKQHMGYSRLRKAVDEMSEKRMQERDEEVRQRYEERRPRVFGAGSGSSDGGKWGRKRDDFDDARRSRGGGGDGSGRDRRDGRSSGGGDRGDRRSGHGSERERGGERSRYRRDDRDNYREHRDQRHRSRSRY